jgi:hypothetical protein
MPTLTVLIHNVRRSLVGAWTLEFVGSLVGTAVVPIGPPGQLKSAIEDGLPPSNREMEQ